uniref:Uncharacterized protein n=1 Tax=Setaria digitata TaxID=48799 RepID=A0A915Q217_9BILA
MVCDKTDDCNDKDNRYCRTKKYDYLDGTAGATGGNGAIGVGTGLGLQPGPRVCVSLPPRTRTAAEKVSPLVHSMAGSS